MRMNKRFFIYCNDGTVKEGSVECTKRENGAWNATITEELDYSTVNHIEIPVCDKEMKAGDDGFFLVQSKDFGIGYFRERADVEQVMPAKMSFLGVKHGEDCSVAIVTGMFTDLYQITRIKDNRYEINMRFALGCRAPYENISVDFYEFRNADAKYSDFTRIYRDHQLANGFKTLKERSNKYLEYMADSSNVRIRMGWKPVPCQIFEQTVDSEPPMHVACTFKDVVDLMEEYHRAGVKKAEFCLVGWNVKGHDGRWPQIFPVEETLGGEEGLREVIKKAEEYGYEMTCHTNSSDAYSIANNFRLGDMIQQKDGRPNVAIVHWAGGRAYNMCPKKAYDISMETLPPVADLGFRGMHYIDVITCVSPRECYSPVHPINKREGCEYYMDIFKACKDMFGAIGSEGPFDQTMRECDSSLYISFSDFEAPFPENDIMDERAPLWQLVYHGIVFSNPYSRTINVLTEDTKDGLLKTIEYGGRPQLYLYASFVNRKGGNWIGKGDLYCHTKEEREYSAKIAKETEDIYGEMAYLQYELMEDHEKLSDGVFKTTYSDGSYIIVDYNEKTYKLVRG